MFKKAIIALSIAAVSAASVLAQSSADDYKKVEFFAGYSNGQIDTGVNTGSDPIDFLRDRENFNGVNVSGVYNASRYFGVKADYSATFNTARVSETFTAGGLNYTVGFENKNQLHNFVGGVQIKDNANDGVFKPFAHAMAGVAHARTKFQDFACTAPAGGNCDPFVVGNQTFTETGFSGIIGGGIDFRIGNRFQIRAIQVDYNPTRLGGETQHNLRLGTGIVF